MLDFSRPETEDEFQASGSLVAADAIPAIRTQERFALGHLIAHDCNFWVNDKNQFGDCDLFTITLGIHRNQNKREIFSHIIFHYAEYCSYLLNDLAERPGKGMRFSIPLYGTHSAFNLT